MKKKFTLLVMALLVSAIAIHAQTLQWTYKDKALADGAVITVDTYDLVMGQMLLELGLKNTSAADQQVSVTKEEKRLAPGGEVQLCVGEICYPSQTYTTASFTIPANTENKTFHANYLVTDPAIWGTSSVVFTASIGAAKATVHVRFAYSGEVAGAALPLTYDRLLVLEEMTGTWCGYCPREIVALDRFEKAYPNKAAIIAVHGIDVMAIQAYIDRLQTDFPVGYPNTVINRKQAVNFYLYSATPIPEIAEEPAPAAVSLFAQYVSGDDQKLAVKIRSRFSSAVEGADYRFALVLTEDKVQGVSSDYNQYNYYSGSPEAMGGYESLPAVIPASQMVYRHVARAIYGGVDGFGSSLPASFPANEEQVFTYTVDLPGNIMNKENLELVALLIDAATGEVINAAKTSLGDGSPVGVGEVKTAAFDAKVYSLSSSLNVELSGIRQATKIAVFNVLGQQVASQTVQADGTIVFPLHTKNTVFVVKISSGQDSLVRKIYH
ncbi:thiol-disulfide isomerase/thioredoxin [Parabacteroides sp. PF5-5]|uniref:Omp28-related outer membrane protein n=1 Tax=unclassified Parabacteroides TaxID=2649774 RepID=UPI002473BADF|nr:MULTISPECIES: Omp28-related outer membrane protein [unclassified Parabacteroides]MDH6303391.1 thiol-disulfide isomerase/thioredoxin [Parabacteroides sp. PH5-39]MDH6314714.1 thiol-disulfide isomerase/thioredoxin [Parabacteroides sp. PF5-13]MDH6318051.1 thiol-disulfide isomerase/thioredoxin [Parabacteroides sp. PH5-13]MDH6322018.1 thiol-disulfide isomerase/thioredoxin [Parabacteroides sp. PH5-8]MDH6326141.1 thiol-disulfide isomerase/thioredoxin [Parabacteroides sp. PH5-41]